MSPKRTHIGSSGNGLRGQELWNRVCRPGHNASYLASAFPIRWGYFFDELMHEFGHRAGPGRLKTRTFFHRQNPVPDIRIFGLALFFRRHGNWSGVMASWRKPDPELLPVHRPLCPKCQKRMTTTAVSDGPEGFERRRFECLKCTVTEIRTLASDPIKSDALRWLSGEPGRRSE